MFFGVEVYAEEPADRLVTVTIEVREVAPSELSIRLLSARAHRPQPTVESVHRAFREQVFAPLREWVARHRAHDD